MAIEDKHTAIPDDELRVFSSLKNIRRVFDVGSREDIDYLIFKPRIELHAFEPHKPFFDQLVKNLEGELKKDAKRKKKKLYLNNFGLGEFPDKYQYNQGSQSINKNKDENGVKIVRGVDYIKQHKIKSIDFLKIDTEGYEMDVLRGLEDKIRICRYIQFEGNDIKKSERPFIEYYGFDVYYIGYSNSICIRKGEPMCWLPPEPREGGLQEKTTKNYLK